MRSSTTTSAATSTASLTGGGPSVTAVMDDGSTESGLGFFLFMYGIMDTRSVLKGVVMFVGMSGGISKTRADALIVAAFVVVVTVSFVHQSRGRYSSSSSSCCLFSNRKNDSTKAESTTKTIHKQFSIVNYQMAQKRQCSIENEIKLMRK